MRKKSLKHLLRTCPGRESGNSAEEASAEEEEDSTVKDSNLTEDVESVASDALFVDSENDPSAKPERQHCGFTKAGDLPPSSNDSSIYPSECPPGDISPNRNHSSVSKDRFSLKSNRIPMSGKSKSRKRKLAPSAEDGRTQPKINSFFGGPSTKGREKSVGGTTEASGLSSVSASGLSSVSGSASTSSSPEKVSGGSSSQSMVVSTLDGFVSTSPRKSATTSKGKITSVTATIKQESKRAKSTPNTMSAFDETRAGIDDLPDEILESIFCQIPHNDLVLQTKLVCKRWNEIIRSERFMPYKKLYYAYKKTNGAHFAKARQEVRDMLQSCTDQNLCFLSFIRNMKSFVACSAGGSSPRIKSALRSMSNYAAVERLFKEQKCLEDCVENVDAEPSSREPSPFCALAAMLVLAPDVDSTSTLLRRLLAADGVPIHLVLEIFYAAATYFLAFHRMYNHSDLHHYIVFTAIYFFENQMQVDRETLDRLFDRESSGQQSLVKFVSNNQFLRLTHEQFRIISSDIKPGEVIKINAFAGTGKTTTLIHYTQARPSKKFLYIAYNKAIKLDAEKRFPQNVVCKTMHSIAFMYKGWLYAQNKKLANLKTRAVVDVLEKKKGFDQNLRASFAIKTIDGFIASHDREMVLNHVPQNNDNGPITPEFRDQHLEDARVIWEKMKDVKDPSIPMTHDGYLKLYQLHWKPDFAHTLRKTAPFDILLVDEAQDLTPACIDILMRQTAPKILVGDPNQQIYSFRGAVNAMSLVQGSQIHYLTQSFRFGPQIAHLCDSLLTGMKGIDDRTIIGNPKNGSIYGGVLGQLCIISRTNFQQFVEAVEATDPAHAATWKRARFVDLSAGETNNNNDNEKETKGKSSTRHFPSIAFTGQDKEDFLLQVMDAFYLFSGMKSEIKDSFIQRFENFAKFAAYAKRVSDFEILGKCQIVQKYAKDTYKYVQRIRRHMTDRLDTADLVLTTAHKAKGLEFDTVKLSEDFLMGLENPDLISLRRCEEDEKNLLYVAVSRAKKSLIMNETLCCLLRLFGEPFASVRRNPFFGGQSGSAADWSISKSCILEDCDETVPTENSWVVGRPSINIRLPYEGRDSHNSVKGGCFCRKHGQLVLPTFAHILRTPINLPKPKEKLKFSFSFADAAGNGDNDDEAGEDVDPLPNTRSAYDHLGGAFMRPRDEVTDGVNQFLNMFGNPVLFLMPEQF